MSREGRHPADLVLLGGRVFTSNSAEPWAQALAVKAGRFVYVGDDEGVRDFIGPHTQVIDCNDLLITPGFVDNHCHVFWMGGLTPFLVMLYEATDIAGTTSRVLDHAAKNPKDPFILGVGWRYQHMPGGMPHKRLLDEVIPDRPVFLWSLDGANGWVNTKALERMRAKNPAAFEKLRPQWDEVTKEPTGAFTEFHGFNPFDFFSPDEIPPDVEDRMIQGMRKILDEALSLGVTTFNDAQMHHELLPTVLKLREQGGLAKVRARALLHLCRESLDDEKALTERLQWWKETGRQLSDDRLHLGEGLKLCIDGVFGSHTAAMHEDYADAPGNKGRTLLTQETLDRVIGTADRLGLSVGTHSVGDRGITMVLDACEKAQKANGKRDSRHRIEHCELPVPRDIERLADLGVYAAMQPTHFYSDPDIDAALGLERLQRLMPWQRLQKANVEVSFGSDWCAGPINPVYGLLIAGTRMNYKEETDWGPEEAVSVEDAIRNWTIGSARALFWEKEIGSIEVGKFADFVLFGEDITEAATVWFFLSHEIELGGLDDFVLLTVVGGEIVYARPGLEY